MVSGTEDAGDGRGDGRQRLLERLRRLAMVAGQPVTLASGRTSDIYFDMKMAMFDAETMALIADAVLDRVAAENATLIGGLEMGAVPIVAAVVCRSHPQRPVGGFFVRKSVKAHGTQKKIEGPFDPAARILLIEDVTTSGGSVMEAVRAVRAEGGRVATVITIVDRQEGAAENLAAEGITLRPVFRKDDFRR